MLLNVHELQILNHSLKDIWLQNLESTCTQIKKLKNTGSVYIC